MMYDDPPGKNIKIKIKLLKGASSTLATLEKAESLSMQLGIVSWALNDRKQKNT